MTKRLKLMLLQIIGVAFFSYLLGSFPTAYLLVKWCYRRDVREGGSGNVGALNTLRLTGSKISALVVLIVDALKGFVTMYLIQLWVSSSWSIIFIAALFVILGHNFSIWLRFQGGRGLATSAGVFLKLQPAIVGIWLLLWLITWVVSRRVAFGNAFATILTPFVLLIPPLGLYSPPLFFLVLMVAAIVFWRHIPRLRQSLDQRKTQMRYQ